MEKFPEIIAELRWRAGQLLPGHQFRIYDFAILIDSGKIVLLTDVRHAGEKYHYIVLDDLECGIAAWENFRKVNIGEITAEYEDLKRKLKRIQGYWGETYYQNLLKQVEPGWPVDTPGAENEPS